MFLSMRVAIRSSTILQGDLFSMADFVVSVFTSKKIGVHYGEKIFHCQRTSFP
jgi:hypothetical protein